MDYDNGKHEGRLIVGRDLTFAGMLNGDMVVPAGVHVVMTGTINGDLIAETGSRVVVCGTVDRYVRNDGGDVEIQGVVRGAVIGECRIAPEAKIGSA